ncbi:antibiotic biosynthesis monooxygenase [Bradyrhizobium jicamae]
MLGREERCDQVLPLSDRARSLNDEPGNLRFEVAIPREGESRILIYEVY